METRRYPFTSVSHATAQLTGVNHAPRTLKSRAGLRKADFSVSKHVRSLLRDSPQMRSTPVLPRVSRKEQPITSPRHFGKQLEVQQRRKRMFERLTRGRKQRKQETRNKGQFEPLSALNPSSNERFRTAMSMVTSTIAKDMEEAEKACNVEGVARELFGRSGSFQHERRHSSLQRLRKNSLARVLDTEETSGSPHIRVRRAAFLGLDKQPHPSLPLPPPPRPNKHVTVDVQLLRRTAQRILSAHEVTLTDCEEEAPSELEAKGTALTRLTKRLQQRGLQQPQPVEKLKMPSLKLSPAVSRALQLGASALEPEELAELQQTENRRHYLYGLATASAGAVVPTERVHPKWRALRQAPPRRRQRRCLSVCTPVTTDSPLRRLSLLSRHARRPEVRRPSDANKGEEEEEEEEEGEKKLKEVPEETASSALDFLLKRIRVLGGDEDPTESGKPQVRSREQKRKLRICKELGDVHELLDARPFQYEAAFPSWLNRRGDFVQLVKLQGEALSEKALEKAPVDRTSFEVNKLTQYLSKVRFIAQLPRNMQLDVCRYTSVERFRAGETVYAEGTFGDRVFIILRGSCVTDRPLMRYGSPFNLRWQLAVPPKKRKRRKKQAKVQQGWGEMGSKQALHAHVEAVLKRSLIKLDDKERRKLLGSASATRAAAAAAAKATISAPVQSSQETNHLVLQGGECFGQSVAVTSHSEVTPARRRWKHVAQLRCSGKKSMFAHLVQQAKQRRRHETVMALTDCVLISLKHDHLEEIEGKYMEKQTRSNVLVLKALPFFASWPMRRLHKLAMAFISRSFVKGNFVGVQRCPADSIVLLAHGEVVLIHDVEITRMRRWPTSYNTWEVVQTVQREAFTIACPVAPCYLGCEALLNVPTRDFSIRVSSNTAECLLLPRSMFMLLFQEDTFVHFRQQMVDWRQRAVETVQLALNRAHPSKASKAKTKAKPVTRTHLQTILEGTKEEEEEKPSEGLAETGKLHGALVKGNFSIKVNFMVDSMRDEALEKAHTNVAFSTSTAELPSEKAKRLALLEQAKINVARQAIATGQMLQVSR